MLEQTRKVLLFGTNTSRSISPKIHNYFFKKYNINANYKAVSFDRNKLAKMLQTLQSEQYLGANITIPYKETVIPFLHEKTQIAEKIGAVNTIIQQQGKLLGDNTDAEGFVLDLQRKDINPVGKQVVLLGAGGAAKAIGFGLLQMGCTEFEIYNRSQTRAQALVKQLKQENPKIHCRVVKKLQSKDRQIIINCTPVGTDTKKMLWPENEKLLSSHVVIDLIYRQTYLLKKAKSAGAVTIDGTGMLIQQAAIGFLRWTGIRPCVNQLYDLTHGPLQKVF